jgi:hypothetical protein
VRTDNERLWKPNAEVSRDPCPGEEWAYRLRDDAPSERVHIVAVHKEGRKFRVDIRHMHGHPPGREENVPRSRLKVPWEDAVPYDALVQSLFAPSNCKVND